MYIQTFNLHPYQLDLTNGKRRYGIWIEMVNDQAQTSWGEVAPLPGWSQESLEQAVAQLQEKKPNILRIYWSAKNCFKQLTELQLLPSVSFGLESALLSLLLPLPSHTVAISALFMGSSEEILEQAKQCKEEGYTSAKLKVSQLGQQEAFTLIETLKNQFRLRIDVNRAWNTQDSLCFFKRFALDTFDYVEEPFQNPHDLHLFPHPLAIDESYPHDVSLEELQTFPSLKALIYKPTMQGGIHSCLALKDWAQKKQIDIVLSSSFESDLGLAHIASMAYRLNLKAPIGIGTYHYLQDLVCQTGVTVEKACFKINSSPFLKNLR